jgi:hypothetical protein
MHCTNTYVKINQEYMKGSCLEEKSLGRSEISQNVNKDDPAENQNVHDQHICGLDSLKLRKNNLG